MKKIILSFILFSVFAYVLACAWALDWLDSHSTKNQFFSRKQNKSTITLDVAKTIWQITPAFDKEKDAGRAWIISELYLSYLSVYSDKQEMLDNLKKSYGVISSYREVPDKWSSIFIKQKVTIIGASLGEIKDKELEKFFETAVLKLNSDNMLKTFRTTIRHAWFDYSNNQQDNFYWLISQRILLDESEKRNVPFYTIGDYHSGLRLCYDKYLSKENGEEHNIESQKIFQQLQKQMTPQNQEYKMLSSYLDEDYENSLLLIPLISSNQTECEKEVKNFADKMVELANN